MSVHVTRQKGTAHTTQASIPSSGAAAQCSTLLTSCHAAACLPCSYMCRASPEPWLCASQLFAPAASLARAKVLAALAPHDLELLQQSAHGASMLLTLPYDVLLQLLRSHETRVAAESSVAALITTWLAAQPEPATPEQQLELAHCLRLRGMPAYYLQQVGWAGAVAGLAAAGLAAAQGPAESKQSQPDVHGCLRSCTACFCQHHVSAAAVRASAGFATTIRCVAACVQVLPQLRWWTEAMGTGAGRTLFL